MVAGEPITGIFVSVLALFLGGFALLTRVFPWKGYLAGWPVFVWLGPQLVTLAALALH